MVHMGILFAMAGLVASALAQSWLQLVLALAPLSIGLSIATPSLNSLLSRESPPDAYGHTLGLSQSVAALARVLGPFVAGIVFDQVGVPAPFLFSALLLGGAYLVARQLKSPAVAASAATTRQATQPSP